MKGDLKGYGLIVADEAQNRRMYGLWNTPEEAGKIKEILEAETPWPWNVTTVRSGS